MSDQADREARLLIHKAWFIAEGCGFEKGYQQGHREGLAEGEARQP